MARGRHGSLEKPHVRAASLLGLVKWLIIRCLGPIPSLLRSRALRRFPWVKTLSVKALWPKPWGQDLWPKRRQLEEGLSLAELATALSAHGGGALSADLALDLVLNEIVEHARLATGATAAAIALVRGDEIVCRATTAPTLLTSESSWTCIPVFPAHASKARSGNAATTPKPIRAWMPKYVVTWGCGPSLYFP